MIIRLFAAGFVFLLVLVSWLAIGHWYGDVGLKHKHRCALQLQTINMGLDKVSRALLVMLVFFFKTTIVLLLFASIDALKNTERSSFHTEVEEHDSEVQINWWFGNCSWRGQRPIAPEIVEVTVAMAENAGRNVRSSPRNGKRTTPYSSMHRDLRRASALLLFWKKKNSFTTKALTNLSRPMLIATVMHTDACVSTLHLYTNTRTQWQVMTLTLITMQILQHTVYNIIPTKFGNHTVNSFLSTLAQK